MTGTLFPVDFTPAVFSPCRTYRYLLSRQWSAGPAVAFILLNPSTADETTDDPTIRRCIGFAKRWGAGSLVLGNIFALRSTNPKALYGHADPVGPENDAALSGISASAEKVVCGWGTHGDFMQRGSEVLAMLKAAGVMPLALTITSGGHPGHPLYLSATADPSPL